MTRCICQTCRHEPCACPRPEPLGPLATVLGLLGAGCYGGLCLLAWLAAEGWL